MFKNDMQRGRVCAALTELVYGGPWWAPLSEGEIPRPTEKAIQWAERGAVDGEPWARALLGFAWTFWNPRDEPRMAPMVGFDSSNTRMVGELLIAYATSPHEIERWLFRWEGRL